MRGELSTGLFGAAGQWVMTRFRQGSGVIRLAFPMTLEKSLAAACRMVWARAPHSSVGTAVQGPL